MDLTPRENQQLEDYQQMMGGEAGQLALALDSLTDVMALLSQHKVYCRAEKAARTGEASLDLLEIIRTVEKVKGLVQKTLMSLREDKK